MRKKLNKVIPTTRGGRVVVGGLLILGGIFGFLPILGFWMIPLGLFVLSIDFPTVRQVRRKCEVKIGRWWQQRKKIKKSK